MNPLVDARPLQLDDGDVRQIPAPTVWNLEGGLVDTGHLRMVYVPGVFCQNAQQKPVAALWRWERDIMMYQAFLHISRLLITQKRRVLASSYAE